MTDATQGQTAELDSVNHRDVFQLTHITKDAVKSLDKINGKRKRRYLEALRSPIPISQRHTSVHGNSNHDPMYSVHISDWRLGFVQIETDSGRDLVVIYAGSHEDYNGFKDHYKFTIPNYVSLSETDLLESPLPEDTDEDQAVDAFAEITESLKSAVYSIFDRAKADTSHQLTEAIETQSQAFSSDIDKRVDRVKKDLSGWEKKLESIKEHVETGWKGVGENLGKYVTDIESLLNFQFDATSKLNDIVVKQIPKLQSDVDERWGDVLKKVHEQSKVHEHQSEQLTDVQNQIGQLRKELRKELKPLAEFIPKVLQHQQEMAKSNAELLKQLTTQKKAQEQSAQLISQETKGTARAVVKEIRAVIQQNQEAAEAGQEAVTSSMAAAVQRSVQSAVQGSMGDTAQQLADMKLQLESTQEQLRILSEPPKKKGIGGWFGKKK